MDIFGRKKGALETAVNELMRVNSANTLQIRDLLQAANGISHNGQRSTYDVYGYPQRYNFQMGYSAIRRAGIANRICVGVPNSCWRNGFTLSEPGDDKTPILEKEIEVIANTDLFSKIERADILNRIGAFSALLVGVPDGQDLDQPVANARGAAWESVYFRPFAFDGVQISSYITDPDDPRYGMPEIYTLQVMGRGDTEKTQVLTSVNAHWSRVVHLAETPLDSDVEGIPFIEPIYNRILDLDKVLGGSAEAYFRNARGKVAFEIDPNFSSDLINNPTAKSEFTEAAKKFTNGWEDQIIAAGSKVKSVDTPHESPIDTARSIIWEISGYSGMPLRVLTGEGAGQLAGSEDRLAYSAMINDRQNHTCEPWIRQLFAVFERAGMIALPDTYAINWPLDEPLNENDMVANAKTKSETLRNLTEAASTAGGDGINLESALEHFGLEDISTEDADEIEPIEDPVLDAEETADG